jgi:starch phosphorylase
MFIRMSFICFIASHKVNGVSLEHTSILKGLIFKDFHDLFPNKIISITNGVSQRRWFSCANPDLSKLITKRLGGEEEWLTDLSLL